MCFKLCIFMYVCLLATADAEEPGARILVQVNGKNVSAEENKTLETVIYGIGDRLTFSCDCPAIHQDVRYGEKIVQEWSSSMVYVNQSVHNVSYSIIGDFVDNKSEVYCVQKIWNANNNNYVYVQSRSVKLFMRTDLHFNHIINTVYFNQNKPATHNCHKPDVNQSNIYMRKIIKGSVYNVSEKEGIPLTPVDSGLIFYCEIMHSNYNASLHNKVNYIREIFGMAKYEYYTSNVLSTYTQIGIGVAVVAIVCIVLVASIILYKNKHNKPPDAGSSDDNIYAELVLSESQTPRFISQNRDDAAYVKIIGYLAKKNNSIASVA